MRYKKQEAGQLIPVMELCLHGLASNAMLSLLQRHVSHEAVKRASLVYEEIDNVRESSEKQEHLYPHQGDYELTQCAAYGPVNSDTS